MLNFFGFSAADNSRLFLQQSFLDRGVTVEPSLVVLHAVGFQITGQNYGSRGCVLSVNCRMLGVSAYAGDATYTAEVICISLGNW